MSVFDNGVVLALASVGLGAAAGLARRRGSFAGPPAVTLPDGTILMTEDEWEWVYEPIGRDGADQLDWTSARHKERIERATRENRIWTALDSETPSGFAIVSGKHRVNRLYYVETRKSVPEGQVIEVIDGDDWDEVLAAHAP